MKIDEDIPANPTSLDDETTSKNSEEIVRPIDEKDDVKDELENGKEENSDIDEVPAISRDEEKDAVDVATGI